MQAQRQITGWRLCGKQFRNGNDSGRPAAVTEGRRKTAILTTGNRWEPSLERLAWFPKLECMGLSQSQPFLVSTHDAFRQLVPIL